jgi:hypothetical protein
MRIAGSILGLYIPPETAVEIPHPWHQTPDILIMKIRY